MNSPVTAIKERLSIEDVVSSYIKLERAGANLKARCPFHNEKTPSFFVSPGRGSYYCFGCSASGDIFSFVQEFEGLDFKGALKLLADRAGVELKGYKSENTGEKERLYAVMEESTRYFSDNLAKNKPALEYLKSRGILDKSIEDFRLGFAEDGWQSLFNFLTKKGFSVSEIERAGLIKKGEKGGYYDRFRGRIIFPIADTSGRVIAFSGRLFESVPTLEGVGRPTESVGPKYLNSPETPIFSKSLVLYGLDKAKDAIRKNNFSILVEGQFDLISAHQVGYKNTVATSGTALSDSTMSKENIVSNLGLVRRLSENLVLAFDGDKAGQNATARAGKIALSLGLDVKVVSLPEGMDPADLITKSGVGAWRGLVRDAKHVILFALEKVTNSFEKDPRKASREIADRVLPYVNMLGGAMEQAYFIKAISDRSSIPEGAIRDDLAKVEEEFKSEKVELQKADEAITKDRRDFIERRLAGIVFWKKDVELEKSLAGILDKYKDRESDLIFEAELLYQDSENLEREIESLLANWEKEKINDELLRKIEQLRNTKDKQEEVRLLEEIQALNNKKHEKEK